ncbi:MAG: response regulator, partial [Pseudomonadota bacterium]
MTKKALVVDNDFFFVEFLTELLEQREYEVIKAYDGKEGISKLEEGLVDIIFVDLIMPKIDGRQFIQFTRKKYPDGRFPIVTHSGSIIEQ